MYKKDFRNQLINDILFESGEVIFEGRRPKDWGLPLSQRFYNPNNKDTGALPNFSQKSYNYDNEYDIKNTRYGFTNDDLRALKKGGLTYCAAATEDDHVVLGVCEHDVKDIIVQHSADTFIGEKYGLEPRHHGIRRELLKSLIDKFKSRFITMDVYQKTMMDYLLERYPKMVARHERNIKKEIEEEEEDFVDFSKMSIPERLAYKANMRLAQIQKMKQEENERRREERQNRREQRKLEDKKWYDSQRVPSTDPVEIVVNQVKDELTKLGKSDYEISIAIQANKEALKDVRNLYFKWTYENRGDYMSNGLLNVLNMRYGLRTIMWPDSFWNAKNS